LIVSFAILIFLRMHILLHHEYWYMYVYIRTYVKHV